MRLSKFCLILAAIVIISMVRITIYPGSEGNDSEIKAGYPLVYAATTPASLTPTPSSTPSPSPAPTPTKAPSSSSATSTPSYTDTPTPAPASGSPSPKPTEAGKASVTPAAPVTPSVSFELTDIGKGENYGLPTALLDEVQNPEQAASAAKTAISGMSAEAKAAPEALTVLTSYMEESIAKATTRLATSSNILISKSTTSEMADAAHKAIAAIEAVQKDENIEMLRPLRSVLNIVAFKEEEMDITLDPSFLEIDADLIRIEAPTYSLTISKSFVQENASNGSFGIHVDYTPAVLKTASADPSFISKMWRSLTGNAAASSSGSSVNVSFGSSSSGNVTLSMKYEEPKEGEGIAVISDGASNMASKKNVITESLDAKIYHSGDYKVVVTTKDFSDMEKKTKIMRDAVEYLASNGVISGTSDTTFSPDMPITRAEIAMLMTKTIGYYREGADGKFEDVFPEDWFFSAVGSAKEKSLMSGTNTEGTIFSPNLNIPKDQIVSICARALRTELRYNGVKDMEETLSIYTDRGDLPDWSVPDIALARKVNLLPPSTKFDPTHIMTRGEVAVLLQRLYIMVWN